MTTSSFVLNIELIDGAAQTAETIAVDTELIDGAAQTPETVQILTEIVDGVSATKTLVVPIELLEDAAQAGAPEVILNIAAIGSGAIASRIRAELYDWQVNLRGSSPPLNSILYDSFLIVKALSYVDEFIGTKNGKGSLLSFEGFEWTWTLDGIGPWSAKLPAMTPALETALDSSSQIIKFYLEGYGHFFTGWISEYEISEDGSLLLKGYDLGIFLSRRSSFYRHEFEFGYGTTMFMWAAGQLIPATYTLEFGPNSGSEADGYPIYPVRKRYQSQSVVEMFQELNQIWGTHWRISPVRGDIYIDQMGTDSGKIVSIVKEDDPKGFEQGVLLIQDLKYGKSDDEIINSELAQGSNNAFGVSVELRHSSRQDKFGYYSGTPWSDITFPQFGRSDEIRGWGVDEDAEGVLPTAETTFELGVGISNEFIQSPAVYLAYAVPVTFTNEYDFAWAAAFGYKQLYNSLGGIALNGLRFDLCPDSGGEPDTANAVISTPMGNFENLGDVPEVNEVTVGPDGLVKEGERATYSPVNGVFSQGSDKVHFSEVIWFPDQINGFVRVPAGTYWAVISLTDDRSIKAGDAWNPTIQGTGLETWVAGGISGGGSLWYNYASSSWVEQEGSFTPLVEISGRYNTAASIAAYPYIILGQWAAGIDDTLPTSGKRIFYIRNNTSILAHGLREKVVTFQNAVDSREGVRDIGPSANVLYGSATIHVDRHKDRFELISFTILGGLDLPKPGEKVRVVHRGMAEVEGGATENINRKYVWVDINALYWVLSININISQEGISHIFEVASVPENLLDPNAIPFEVKRAVNRHNNYMSEIEYGQHVGIVQEDF